MKINTTTPHSDIRYWAAVPEAPGPATSTVMQERAAGEIVVRQASPQKVIY
ncbi:hypothetical protein [Ralstonia pseudosolanacearum]|uniref:hypothetical protein n=1 Tax=Ralstonia pseudosolanacearum TaxID=1310165 RepID=UPI0013E352CA|nr:hypothetical protein [Ralstonia pseudosolanacearum]